MKYIFRFIGDPTGYIVHNWRDEFMVYSFVEAEVGHSGKMVEICPSKAYYRGKA